ncbi:hypothetical protein FOZ62_004812 [Perkinsus olseni]|uniref:4-hydroxy-4-methyl-2-oxoglutarate aldolase n=1 Tax=Perkinsus olseni TaxID=32597 RepID=A0A7J6RG81_PEROL|nr:hypothetical protein FOZ62_004812 [Perkinsus olseni]
MEWSTADICDWCGDSVEYVDPLFHSFGMRKQFCGKIRTVKCHEDNSLVKKLLGTPSKGEVLVIDGGGSNRRALVGDLIAASAVKNGWAGVVVYGYIRDSAAINKMDIGVKALGAHPRKTEKKDIGDVDVAVKFGGVVFTPGHWLYSDEDGILFQGAVASEMSDNIIEAASHPASPAKVHDTPTKEDTVQKDAPTEGIITRRKAAALAAAAAAAAVSSTEGGSPRTATAQAGSTVIADDSAVTATDVDGTVAAENAVIPGVKEQQQPPTEDGGSSSSSAAAVAAAAALLQQGGGAKNDEEDEGDAAKTLGLDPSPPATVLPASAQPFLADIPVEKPSASEIRRNLTPREARQLAKLQYHEQLRAYQRWVAAVADAMRERATAAAAATAEHQQEESKEDEHGEGNDTDEQDVGAEATDTSGKRQHGDVGNDDDDGVAGSSSSSSPARKAARTSPAQQPESAQATTNKDRNDNPRAAASAAAAGGGGQGESAAASLPSSPSTRNVSTEVV